MKTLHCNRLTEIANLVSGFTFLDRRVLWTEFEDLIDPTLHVKMEVDVEGVPYAVSYLVTLERDGYYKVLIGYKKHQLGQSHVDSSLILYRHLQEDAPLIIREKLADYKGWRTYLVSKYGSFGAAGSKDNRWLETDVSFMKSGDAADQASLHKLIDDVEGKGDGSAKKI